VMASTIVKIGRTKTIVIQRAVRTSSSVPISVFVSIGKFAPVKMVASILGWIDFFEKCKFHIAWGLKSCVLVPRCHIPNIIIGV
jgi:hypothetical protein